MSLKQENALLERKNSTLQRENEILQEKLNGEQKNEITSENDLESEANSKPEFYSKLTRIVDKRVFPKELTVSGKVVFNICIDRSGKIIYSKIDRDKTTITDRNFLQDASSAMRQTKFKSNSYAPEKECGTWTMNVRAN